MRNPPVRPGFWRGVNNNQNAIYLECFVDELAHAAGVHPITFRRRMMQSHPKHLAVLNAVAESVGWDKPAPAGVFRGYAQHMGYGSYVAACAEVSINEQGTLKIHRIVAATNCGHAVNPAQIERQIEGSFAYGLGPLLFQEITIKDAKVVEENFDTYRSFAWPRCLRLRASSRRRTISGAALASRRSSWRRQPCSTPSSRRRASASATCRLAARICARPEVCERSLQNTRRPTGRRFIRWKSHA